jgi:hypothetical protein
VVVPSVVEVDVEVSVIDADVVADGSVVVGVVSDDP